MFETSALPLYPALTLLHGFTLSAGLIMQVGAQNAFVLKQGLRKEYVFIAAFSSTLFDNFFIFAGVLGIFSLIPAYVKYITIAGSVFLLYYGATSLFSAFRKQKIAGQTDAEHQYTSPKSVLLAASGFSLLNPNVYLDTIVIMGGFTAKYSVPGKVLFAIGAGIASLIWFFALGYGSRFLYPLFRKPRAWRVLDFFVGCLMIAMAFFLAWALYTKTIV
jgi:L-lysine exporter family protein LysE/ArgO